MKTYIVKLFLLTCLFTLVCGCDSMPKEKEEWLIEQAEKGNKDAQYVIATYPDKHHFQSVSKETRDSYYQSLLNQNYVPIIYDQVREAKRKRDISSEIRWLEQAAAQGSDRAMYDLYQIYSSDTKYKNAPQADKWLRAAATAGHTFARNIVRNNNGAKIGHFTAFKEEITDTLKAAKGTFLAKMASSMFRGFSFLFLVAITLIFTGSSLWWAGVLILIGQILFILLFFFVTNHYIKKDISYGKGLKVHWLIWIYLVYGTLITLFGQSTQDIALNIGHLWMLEGTFGFGAKFAVALSWIVLLSTLLAIGICIKSTQSDKQRSRIIWLACMCIYAFAMGAFMSLIAAIAAVTIISKSTSLLTGSLSSLAGGNSDSQSEYNGTFSSGFGPSRKVKDIGVVPGNRVEDEQGNILKKDDNGNFVKEN